MDSRIEEFGPVALQCILEDFATVEHGFIVIYKTKPITTLMDILPLMDKNTVNAWDHYKYNGIPMITMRISGSEYSHYAHLYNNYYVQNIPNENK